MKQISGCLVGSHKYQPHKRWAKDANHDNRIGWNGVDGGF